MCVCLSDCPELIKEFYIEDQEVAMMSHEEADEIRLQNNNIVVNDLSDSGETKRPTPNPCIKFEQAFKHYRKFEQAFEHYRKLEQACRYYHKSHTPVLMSDESGAERLSTCGYWCMYLYLCIIATGEDD